MNELNTTSNVFDEGSGDEEMETTWQSLALWFFLATVSFWMQAIVTEDRFVPALSVISEMFNIPDDVAGATLMAAGASSPELFSSFVALFVTHSALGLGTIVGSEIFNQLTICKFSFETLSSCSVCISNMSHMKLNVLLSFHFF